MVSAVERQAGPGQFRSNKQHASSLTAVRITSEERRIAIKAAKSIGLKVAGVDILRSRKGPLLLEVNSSPSLGDLEEVSGKDLAGAMISAVEKQLGWKRKLATPVNT